MNKKTLKIPFNAPLNEKDTELQTYGCRANNPDICANNELKASVPFHPLIAFVKSRQELGKNNMQN